MTLPFWYEKLEILTRADVRRPFNFRGAPFVGLQGPAAVGKTSAIHTLLYPMGIKSTFRRAVREHVVEVSTTLNLAGQRRTLVRSLIRNVDLIQVFDGRRRPQLLTTLDIQGRHGPTPSDWLFEQLGVGEAFTAVQLPASGGRTRPMSMADFSPAFYVPQDAIDRDLMRHLTHDSARHALVELLLQISSPAVDQARIARQRAHRAVQELRRRLTIIEEFLADNSDDPHTLRTELVKARSELNTCLTRKERLEKSRVDWQCGSDLPTGRGGNRRPRTRPSCPDCYSDLTGRLVPEGQCRLCLMPESTENKPPIGIPPTGTLGGAAPTGDEQELARLRAKIAALTQRIRSLEQLLKPHEDLVRLHAELRDRQRAADAADRLFQQARAEAEVRRSRIYQFSARFQEILNKVPSPWFRGAAHIDPDTYLPVIEDEEVKEMTGSVRTIAIIAYHLAMLSYGLEHRDTYVPQTLILDSPQRNLGNNAEDRLHARRLYASLNLHTLARQQLNMTLGDDLALPPVQVIVADNDIPLRAIGSPVIRHTFTRENPFVPGVVYEEHPEDFEPEADLLA